MFINIAGFFFFTRTMADDFSTSVDTPAVSGGGESSSSPAASSGGVAETQPAAGATQPDQAQQQTVSGGESVATTPEYEFPDEAAFEAMPREERVRGWQNARARITELNGQVKQFADLGDLDQLKSHAELARSLFTYAQDESGNVVYDRNGIPTMTTAPFLGQLQEMSPDTFYTMAWEMLDQPIPEQNITVGDYLLQQRYGLDPQLIGAYRNIQSPEDAVRYTPQTVSSAELTGIPEDLHDAYKSFEAADRVDLQDLFARDEDRFLARLKERQQSIENRQFIREARQQAREAKEQQQVQWENAVRQKATDRGMAKWTTTVQSQTEQLRKQYSPFGPEDTAGNEMVYADVIQAATVALGAPAIQQKVQTADQNYYLHELYTAQGNQMLAAKHLADAERLVLEIQREFAKAATLRVEQWNQRLRNRIVAASVNGQSQQQRPNPANPPQPTNGQSQYKQPGRFGLDQARKREIASQLAMDIARRAG